MTYEKNEKNIVPEAVNEEIIPRSLLFEKYFLI